jgi:hypothetical protein
MSKVAGAVGWAVAVVAILIAAFLAVEVHDLSSQLEDLSALLESAPPAPISSSEPSVATADPTRQIQSELAQTQAALQEFDRQAQTAAVPPQQPSPQSTNRQPGGQPQANQEAQIQTAMRGLVQPIFEPLFTEMDLDPELGDTVLDLVAQSMSGLQIQGMELLGKDGVVARDVKASQDAASDVLRMALTEILTPEQLELWDDFEDVKEIRLFKFLLTKQLATVAPQLTPENHETAKLAMAEELAHSMEAFHNSEEPYTLANLNNAQVEAFHAAQERLAPVFTEEQMAYLNRFIQLAEQTLGARPGEARQPQ